ncbi:MAG: hypothetical protein H0X33_05655 [Taibaiella sp.]|nr:hypothetical protein [Taibaiella sp.]
MLKKIFTLAPCLLLSLLSVAQNKTTVGIVPFKDGVNTNANYQRDVKAAKYTTAIEDAVSDAFLAAKRFTLVDRTKMEQIKSEKTLQKNDDFIDGTVVEQSASLGAQYLVTGNVSEEGEDQTRTSLPYGGSVTINNAKCAFSIKVIDVATGEIVASQSFSGKGHGNNAFSNALEKIKPEIEGFIRDNFKLTASVAEVEEKNTKGDAIKVLISGGSSMGMAVDTKLKVYEMTVMNIDGKKLTRKKTIGTLVITKVEDENFSVCKVEDGGEDIAKKVAAGSKIKCEVIN